MQIISCENDDLSKFTALIDKITLKIPGIKHIIISELETGFLLYKRSRFVDKNLNPNKIGAIMSHIFSISSAELDSEFKLSINELDDYKIIGTKIGGTVLSLVTDKKTQIGLLRMLLQNLLSKNPNKNLFSGQS